MIIVFPDHDVSPVIRLCDIKNSMVDRNGGDDGIPFSVSRRGDFLCVQAVFIQFIIPDTDRQVTPVAGGNTTPSRINILIRNAVW